MGTRFKFRLAALTVMTAMAICWCGLLSLVWRHREPVLLRHVDYQTVERSVWTRGQFPAQATDLTVWYVRGENMYSRFHLSKDAFEAWRVSEELGAPRDERRMMPGICDVMGDDGRIIPLGPPTANRLLWVQPLEMGRHLRRGRIVVFEPDQEVVRMTLADLPSFKEVIGNKEGPELAY